MATSPSSVHSPVAARTIRLLRLGAGAAADPIRFSLESISLDTDPIYEAISYCWGDRQVRKDVTCQGVPVFLTTSLWGALREFRDSVETRILWADAICINQEDKDEKTRQVRLMPEIYARAQRVLVWLGPMDEAGLLSGIHESIQELHGFLPDFDGNETLSQEARQNLVAEMAIRDRREGRPNMDEYDLKPLVELISRPWFTRKWVVQEVSLAREVRLHIGSGVQLPWVDLSSLVVKIQSMGSLPHIVRLSTSLEDIGNFELGLFNLGVMNHIKHFRAIGRGTLVDAVMATRGTSCSDDHDHIYAVLSCASEGPSLDPDYELSVEDTFKKFTAAMLTQDQNLKVLSLEPHKGDRAHLGLPRNRKELPSWVPDLRRPSDPMAVTSVDAQTFHAGGSRKPVLSLSEDGRVLHSQGVIVDEINDIVPSLHEMLRDDLPDLFETYSPIPGAADPYLSRSRRCYRQWIRACHDLADSHASLVDEVGRRDAFSRALLCAEGSSTSGEETAHNISSTFEYVQWILSQDYTRTSSEQKLDRLSQEKSGLATQWGAIESRIAERSVMRNFSIAKSGRLGQMPIGTEKGDLVCVLMGGEVPFVIRPTEGDPSNHSLIGDCFLDGIMNGEALVASNFAMREIALSSRNKITYFKPPERGETGSEEQPDRVDGVGSEAEHPTGEPTVSVSPKLPVAPVSQGNTNDYGLSVEDAANATLGFAELIVINMPDRTDKRDRMTLMGATTGLRFTFLPGVDAAKVPDAAMPPEAAGWTGKVRASWRAHMDALWYIVQHNLSSAVIFEDDLDWDVRIREQARDFALASRALLQPLAGRRAYADPTYPTVLEEDADLDPPPLSFARLPRTENPTTSAYGDGWDVLWLGHCGVQQPTGDPKDKWAERSRHISRGAVVKEMDPSVPQTGSIRSWDDDGHARFRNSYPAHTRVAHHALDAVCTFAYGVSQAGARRILYDLGLWKMDDPFDLGLRQFCDGTFEHARH
ncbi:hypothetical protein diail_10012, partial [Diaporthe ilicicola]